MRSRPTHSSVIIVAERAYVCRDATVPMTTAGQTYYNAVLNACNPIGSYDDVKCQQGTLVCQKTAATGTAYALLGKTIAAPTFAGLLHLLPMPCTRLYKKRNASCRIDRSDAFCILVQALF